MSETVSKRVKPCTMYRGSGQWLDSRSNNRHQQVNFYCLSPSKAAILRAHPELKGVELAVTHEATALTTVTTEMDLFARGIYDWTGDFHRIKEEDKKNIRRG